VILTLQPISAIIIEMYSVKEASKTLGVNERHVRRLLASGEIRGKKLGHDWVVLDLSYKRKRKPKRVKK